MARQIAFLHRTAAAVVTVAALALCACQQKQQAETVADNCHPSDLVRTISDTGYAGAREKADLCIRRAVYAIASGGGPEAAIGPAAVARCQPEEAGVVAELAKSGKVYPSQTAELDDEYGHLASLTAIQARSMGCGGPVGSTT
ncbi:MAG TPA: hypothetical protein VGS12_16900 [Caulobacteraceae bacterium]|nr:hypothetical protein [Caulobacteraceae bacterium]